MTHHGVKFVQGEIANLNKHSESQRAVTYNFDNKTEIFDTVLLAIGREPNTRNLGLEKVGITLSKNNKFLVDN